MIQTPARSSKQQFDRQAAHYDAQWNAWNRESLAWVLENAACRGGEDLLDVATGTGFTALALAPHARSVVGIDVSAGMLAQASRRAEEQGIHNASFREGAAEAIPFADESFDVVTCRIAAHHFLDVRKFVSQAARVLKPGGRFLLADTSVPDGEPEADAWQNEAERIRDPSHMRNYTPDEWRGFIEASGLRIEEMTGTGGGIQVGMRDWLIKAGCSEGQSEAVREMFSSAPESAKRLFKIEPMADGDLVFTWQRILARALKPSWTT